jgi:hypothetical protein
MNALLTPLGEQLGVAISVGRAKYTQNNITFNVEVAKVSATGEVVGRMVEDFLLNCTRYGLKETDLNRVIKFQGTEYQIIGCNPRCWKKSILLKDVARGTIHKSDPSSVAWAISREQLL